MVADKKIVDYTLELTCIYFVDVVLYSYIFVKKAVITYPFCVVVYFVEI